MDIANFDVIASAEGAVMEVRNPGTGEVLRHDPRDGEEVGRPFTITLLSLDHEKVVEASRKLADRRVASTARTRSPVLTAVAEKEVVEILVVATVGWDLVIDGKVPPSKPEAYRAAYLKYRWLQEQVDSFTGARANFLKS